MAKSTPSFLRSLFRVAIGRPDVLIASLAVNFLTLIMPLVILQVYDKVIPNSAYDTLAFLVLGLAAVVVIDWGLRALRSYIIGWEAARFEHAIGRRAIDKLLGAEIEEFERSPAGSHLDRLAAIDSLRDFHSGQGLVAVSDLPFVALFLVFISYIDERLVVPPLAVVGLAGSVALVLGIAIDRAARRRAQLDDERYNFIFQVLNGIHTVKGLGMEAQLVRQYQGLLSPLATAVERLSFLSGVGRSLGPVFSNLAMISVAAYGSLLVVGSTISGGALIASTLLAGRAVQPLIRLISIWIQSQNLKLAQERLDTLMALPQENADPVLSAEMPKIEGAVSLSGVTVHRGMPDTPVLSNVTLDIGAGEFVAVTGPMGSGKSVLLELIGGMIHPDEGNVRYDGLDADKFERAALREQIGYARQHPVLYRGTILENLISFKGKGRLPAALKIANRIGLDEKIALMPHGLETVVGDTASEILPGSMQQEISVCRVLANRPKLLLFDEANSNMDMDADQKLQSLFRDMRGLMTVVMVTSRPSMIALADKVLKVHGGIVLEVEENLTPRGSVRANPAMVPGEASS